MSTDEQYIRKRQRKAKRLSALFLLMRIFPVQKKKITFSAFEGDGGFACNPRYIAEELHRQHPEYKIIWLTHDPTRHFPEYVHPVRDTQWNTAYHLSTAKVWVDNYRKPFGTLKRKGQYYIQTWHASIGFKAVGLYRGDKFPKIARLVSEADSNLIDCMVINSEYCRQVYPKKLLYDGYMFKSGSPRVDCLINDRERLYKEVRSRYALPIDARIVMYAPTFRAGNQSQKKNVEVGQISIDINKLRATLNARDGKQWIVFLRLHPQLATKMETMLPNVSDDSVIDVSQEEDMSELLGATDLLITDYSSCAFDAAFAEIPVLIYADDIQEYIENRGEFMWKREELPFVIAEDNASLMNNIKSFQIVQYLDHVHSFMQKHGVVEDGHSSERVVGLIEEHI